MMGNVGRAQTEIVLFNKNFFEKGRVSYLQRTGAAFGTMQLLYIGGFIKQPLPKATRFEKPHRAGS